MSYQVLARKWRPQGFDDVAGQAHVTTPLRNAIRSQRIPHAILLTGPRGVGKTTLARILARCLNCEEGSTDTPCGECVPCTEITAGRSTDVQEVDAASRTGVDDVRELIEAIRYAPAPGKHKIFVVDEVHMLSTAAFNALLKTLEEPPPNSLFIFATTNPEKIPFTVVSRCQRYDLRRIAAPEIVANLARIAREEKIGISEKSLLSIAREADGSMRDAQTLLDQLVAYGGSEIADDQVSEVLDLVDRRLLLAILTACCRGEAQEALEACARAGASGIDAKRLGEHLLLLLRDLVVLRIAPNGAGLVEGSDEEIAELRAIAEDSEPARLRRMFRALLKEQEDLSWAPQPLAVLEMAVVRLATLPAGDDVQRLLSRIDGLEKRLRGGSDIPGGGTGGGGSARPPPRSKSSSRVASTSTLQGEPNRGADPPNDAAPCSSPSVSSQPDAPLPPSDTPPGGPVRGMPSTTEGRWNAPEKTRPPSAFLRDAVSGPQGRCNAPEKTRPPSPLSRNAGQRPAGSPLHAGAGPSRNRVRGSHTGHAGRCNADESSPEPVLEGPTRHPEDAATLPVIFDRLRATVRKVNPGLAGALDGGRLLEHREGRLRIEVPRSFAARRIEDRRAALEEIFERLFGNPTTFSVETEDEAGTGANGAGMDPESLRQLRQNALDNPGVNAALDVLRGEIVEIRPLSAGFPPGSGGTT